MYKTKTKKGIKKRGEDTSNGKGAEVIAICGYDSTFHVALVYAYGRPEAYSSLEAKFFSKPNLSTSGRSACSFGTGVESLGSMVGFAWVNSEKCKLENSLPHFLHEITHLSQGILDYAGVKDSSGEVQAYLVEREFERLVHEMCNSKPPSTKAISAVESIIQDLFGPSAEENNPSVTLSDLLGLSKNNNHRKD